jgi:haloacetate dehalogenase
VSSHDFLPGFERFDLEIDPGVSIHGASAGSGPAVLLLHGHPQSHATWYRVAPRLVQAGYRVVATDLRGYGDSSRPPGGDHHLNYSKRAMAREQVGIMRLLGHSSFAVVGHDRGGRVAHRMALDYPDTLTHVAVLDIAPTATMYARTDRTFATQYFWWFFLIQPAPLPERLIEGDAEFFLRSHLAAQSRTPGVPSELLLQEYLRCYRLPGTIHAVCEDYRAAASVDLEHDLADVHRRVDTPLLALWGAKGTVGKLYDVLATWREKAARVEGRALECGHVLQEEAPDQCADALIEFLGAGSKARPPASPALPSS